jgi:Tol biopolymer transport system component
MVVSRANSISIPRALSVAGLVGLFVLSAVSTAKADPAAYAGASASGEDVFFTTSEKLVPGDTDNKRDVYERFYEGAVGIESFVTREVSTGPTGGNDAYDVSFDGVSADGSKLFFSTNESLAPGDEDLSADIYRRNLNTGATSLVSAADPSCSTPGCGNAADPVSFDAVSSDGTRVLFSTDEPLSGEDGDSVEDVYVRDLQAGGGTTLVSEAAPSCSTPGCGDAASPASFDGSSADALSVAFSTDEPLSGEDEDSAEDVYVRDVQGGTTDLVSLAGTCPSPLGPGECTPIFEGISSDGSHVFFETGEQVAAGEDTDDKQDVYGWSGGTPVRVSTGAGGGNGADNATYQGTTADGSAAFFETDESLAPADGDTVDDVYERAGGETVLVSTGPTDSLPGSPAHFERATADGASIAFTTAQPLTGEDTDSSRDVYLRDPSGESTTLVSVAGAGCGGSCGSGEIDASFAGASADQSAVFFETAESLVGADGDASSDVYERAGAETTLVSTGPSSENGPSSPHLADVSQDGAHALFTTDERLTAEDLDAEVDVYDHTASGIALVSAGNSAELTIGPAMPRLIGTNPASPNASIEPTVFGEAAVGSAIKLYTTPDCSGAPAATGSAAQLEAVGIAVKVAPGSTSVFHATATLVNDTSACSTTVVTYSQVSESAGGGGGGGSGGSGGGGSGGTSGVGGGTAGSHRGHGGSGASVDGHVTPRTRITFAPASKTRLRRPSFQFVDSTEQGDTRFICAVDRRRWTSCSSPTKLKKLGRGRHVFKVKGVNSGLWEAAPATRSFKVVSR